MGRYYFLKSRFSLIRMNNFLTIRDVQHVTVCPEKDVVSITGDLQDTDWTIFCQSNSRRTSALGEGDCTRLLLRFLLTLIF